MQRLGRKGLGAHRPAQEIARAKQDLPLFGRQCLHAIAHEIDLGMPSQPFAQRLAEPGQFIRRHPLNGQQQHPAGQARAYLRQQQPLRGRGAFGKQVTEFAMDRQTGPGEPECTGDEGDPDENWPPGGFHLDGPRRSVITERSPSGARMAMVVRRPSDPDNSR